MNSFYRIIALCLILFLASCQVFDSKKVEYKSAGKLPSLEVPPDLVAPSRDERYTVPDINPSGSATYSSYDSDRKNSRGGAQDILPTVDKVRVERSGSQRWLVVPGTPDKVWPIVKTFWLDQGLSLKQESPELGIMETDWAENRAKIPSGGIRSLIGKVLDQAYDSGERDKFRTRLERGIQPDTTEIYISHRGMVEVYTDSYKATTVWQPRPTDIELETEMLNRLMVRFGVEDERAKAQLAEKKEERSKQIQAKDGTEMLELADPFDRAWRRVGLALDRVGFTIEDRDRSRGLYFVRHVNPELDSKQEKGFLSKLFSSDSSAKGKGGDFRILVTDQSNLSYVQIVNKEGIVEKSDTAKKILALLHDQLK